MAGERAAGEARATLGMFFQAGWRSIVECRFMFFGFSIAWWVGHPWGYPLKNLKLFLGGKNKGKQGRKGPKRPKRPKGLQG